MDYNGFHGKQLSEDVMNQAQEIKRSIFTSSEKQDMAERQAVSFQRPFSNVTKFVFDDNSTLTFTFGEFRSVKTIKASR